MDADARARARLEHASAGRVRLRLRKGDRTTEHVERVRRQFEGHADVGQVEINPQTGSVLLLGRSRDGLLTAAEQFLEIMRESAADRSGDRAVSTLVSAVRQIDERIGAATQGRVSLRWLVPVTFVGFGLRQLVIEGLTIGTVPWYVLLYYGVDSFMKLYPEHAPRVPPGASAAVR